MTHLLFKPKKRVKYPVTGIAINICGEGRPSGPVAQAKPAAPSHQIPATLIAKEDIPVSQALELPDPIYNALVRAAKSKGTTPLEWIVGQLPPMDSSSTQSPTTSQDVAQAVAGAEEDELADARPWRGVLVLPMPQQEIFTQEMEFRTSDLPKWQPSVVINPRRLEADDE
jgi:hypothetical protein